MADSEQTKTEEVTVEEGQKEETEEKKEEGKVSQDSAVPATVTTEEPKAEEAKAEEVDANKEKEEGKSSRKSSASSHSSKKSKKKEEEEAVVDDGKEKKGDDDDNDDKQSVKSHKSDKSDKSDKEKEQEQVEAVATSADAEQAENGTEDHETQQEKEEEAAALDDGDKSDEVVQQSAEQEEVEQEEQEQESASNEVDIEREQEEEVRDETFPGDEGQDGTESQQNGLVNGAAVEITEEQNAKYRQIFDKKAVNDRLDLKGFKILFRLMGEVVSSEDAEQMFQDGDRDDNGTIEFDEFCRLYHKFRQEEAAKKASLVQSVDKLFPSDNDEPVKLKKVEKLLMKLQQPDLGMRLVREKSDLGKDDIKHLVRAMDKDGNGLISRSEFVETLCSHMDM